MPSIPTGGSELPRPVVETGATTRIEPAMRSPPMVPANPETAAKDEQAAVERRKEERRQRREQVARERRARADRRRMEKPSDTPTEAEPGEASQKGRFINIRV